MGGVVVGGPVTKSPRFEPSASCLSIAAGDSCNPTSKLN